MMTLAEKIAEKKRLAALAAQQATGIVAETVAVVAPVSEPVAPVATVADIPAPKANQAVVDNLAAMQVPTHDANGKPLSGFALVKARKEHAARLAALQANSQSNVQIQSPVPPAPTSSPVSTVVQDTVETATGGEPVMQELAEAIAVDIEHDEKEANATPETRQAYADVKERLNNLVSVAGDDLRNEMALLKKALMQNPNAVELMLPSDIGQMVIALRKMTGVELAAVKAGKTASTKAKKEVPLTAEQLEAAWEEL